MVFGCFNSASDGLLINALSHDIYHPWKLTFVNPVRPLNLNKIFKRSTWLCFDVLVNNPACIYFWNQNYIWSLSYFKSLILLKIQFEKSPAHSNIISKIRIAPPTYKSSQRKLALAFVHVVHIIWIYIENPLKKIQQTKN